MELPEKIKLAMEIAKKYHDEADQKGYFETHIMRCYEIAISYFMYGCPDTKAAYAEKFKYTAPDTESVRNYAIWFNEHELVVVLLHDILEDTIMTYDKLAELFNYNVADDVFNLSDGEGENRKEKKMNTYWKIRRSSVSILAKLIDRVANVEKSSGASDKDRNYLNMYMKEYYSFKCALWGGPFDDRKWLWDMLDKMHGFSFKK